jgi:hypothetical protein
MSPELALKLIAIFEAYFKHEEFAELAALFEVQLDAVDLPFVYNRKPWLAPAREIVMKLDHGNTRRVLDSILDLADNRNSDSIAHTDWERRDYHGSMASVIKEARALLEASSVASEITVPAGHVFSAKSKVRELLETATTEIFLIDPYVGIGTLDCLRNIKILILAPCLERDR